MLAYDRIWRFKYNSIYKYHILLEFTTPVRLKINDLTKHPVISNNVISASWNSKPVDGKYNLGLNLITITKYHQYELIHVEDVPINIIDDIVQCLREYNITFENIRIDNRFGDLNISELQYVPKCLTLIDCLFQNLEISNIVSLHISSRDWGVNQSKINISFDKCQNAKDVKIIGNYSLKKRTMYNLLKLPKLKHLLIKKP